MVQAIYFDLFETLVTETNRDEKHRHVAYEKLGIDAFEFKKEWRKRNRRRYMGEFKDYPAIIRDICNSKNVSVDEEVLHELQLKRIEAKSIPFQKIEIELIEVLQKLKNKDIKLAIVSNAAYEEVLSWSKCDLAEYFDEVIFSYQVGYMKPDKEIYHIACKRLNVSPDKCAFIGDGGCDELSGAEDTGITPYRATWFIDRYQESNNKEYSSKYKRLKNYKDILDII